MLCAVAIKKIGTHIRQSIVRNGCPPVPQCIPSVEYFFDSAKTVADKIWKDVVAEEVALLLKQWSKEVESLGSGYTNHDQIHYLFSHPKEFEKKLAIRQLSIFESLRIVAPDVWSSLLLLSSKRQQHTMSLVRQWAEQLNEKNKIKGIISKQEIILLIDLAMLVGPWVDAAYIQQVKYTTLLEQDKARYASKRDVHSPYMYLVEENTRETFADLFGVEMRQISKGLKKSVCTIRILILQEKLPNIYSEFAMYLEKMAELFVTTAEDVKKKNVNVNKEWSVLRKQMGQLIVSGCPIVVVPQACSSISSVSDVVDIELRFGFQTDETKQMQQVAEIFREKTQQINDAYQSRSSSQMKQKQVPFVAAVYMPFSFGPNLYWNTRGEAGVDSIILHPNSIRTSAKDKEIVLLKKAFDSSYLAQYVNTCRQAVFLDSTLHELGHVVYSKENKRVRATIKTVNQISQDILEELKAETYGMYLLLEYLHDLRVVDHQINMEEQLVYKIGTNLDYIMYKSPYGSGERYYKTGLIVLKTLVACGGMVIDHNGAARIADVSAGARALAQLHLNVVSFYQTGDSKTVEHYIHAAESIHQDVCKGGAVRGAHTDIIRMLRLLV